MSKQTYECSWCGNPVLRYPSQVGKSVYCSKACRTKDISKETNPDGYTRHPHLSEYNAEFNVDRMTFETRSKLREAHLDTGEGKSYSKIYSRHAHRVIAEEILGRPLRSGEVVHHIDGDKRNNDPSNLKVFGSQKRHAEYHQMLDRFFRGEVIR